MRSDPALSLPKIRIGLGTVDAYLPVILATDGPIIVGLRTIAKAPNLTLTVKHKAGWALTEFFR